MSYTFTQGDIDELNSLQILGEYGSGLMGRSEIVVGTVIDDGEDILFTLNDPAKQFGGAAYYGGASIMSDPTYSTEPSSSDDYKTVFFNDAVGFEMPTFVIEDVPVVGYQFTQSDMDTLESLQIDGFIGTDLMGKTPIVLGSVVEDGDTVQFEITDPDNVFTEPAQYGGASIMDDPTYSSEPSGDFRTVTFSNVIDFEMPTFSIGQPPKEDAYQLKQVDFDNNPNSTFWCDDNQLSVGDYFKTNSENRIECVENYIFDQFSGALFYYPNSAVEVRISEVGTFNETSDVYTFHLESVSQVSNLSFNGISTTQKPNEPTDPNKSYVVNVAQVAAVNNKRFAVTETGVDSEIVVDHGMYILGLIKLPFEIPSDLILEDETISLGGVNTGVSAPKLSKTNIRYDLGEIEIPSGDETLSYVGKSLVLHIPYMASTELDTVCIGGTLTIHMDVDLSSGNATVMAYSSKVDGIVLQSTLSLGVDVPYAQVSENSVSVANSNLQLGGDNGILRAYVEIRDSVSSVNNEAFNGLVVDYGQISNVSGHFTVQEVDLLVNASGECKSKIRRLLEGGVIIR